MVSERPSSPSQASPGGSPGSFPAALAGTSGSPCSDRDGGRAHRKNVKGYVLYPAGGEFLNSVTIE